MRKPKPLPPGHRDQAYKYELLLNSREARILSDCCGYAKYLYNYGVGVNKDAYKRYIYNEFSRRLRSGEPRSVEDLRRAGEKEIAIGSAWIGVTQMKGDELLEVVVVEQVALTEKGLARPFYYARSKKRKKQPAGDAWMYDQISKRLSETSPQSYDSLLRHGKQALNPRRLRAMMIAMKKDGLLYEPVPEEVRLTEKGFARLADEEARGDEPKNWYHGPFELAKLWRKERPEWAQPEKIKERNARIDAGEEEGEKGVVYPSCIIDWTLYNLNRGFQNYFKAKKAGRKVGFPVFKKKSAPKSVSLGGNLHAKGRYVRFPNIGWMRTKETIRLKGTIKHGTVTQEGFRWFVSFAVVRHRRAPGKRPGPKVGVSLGITNFCTVAYPNGTFEFFDHPRPLKKQLDRMKLLQRRLSRKKRGSANWKKARVRLNKLHWRIKCIRKDFLHNLTSRLVKWHQEITIQDFTVKQMLEQKGEYKDLSKHIADMGWATWKNQMIYKASWYGCNLILAAKNFPSARTCSGCGHVKEKFPLHIRVYQCEACGLQMQREKNTATNLLLMSPPVEEEDEKRA